MRLISSPRLLAYLAMWHRNPGDSTRVHRHIRRWGHSLTSLVSDARMSPTGADKARRIRLL